MAQELLTTFQDELHGVLLQPSEVNGRYCIYVNDEEVFNRKKHGGFIDIKPLKQIIRDKVAPGKSLGHSDVVK